METEISRHKQHGYHVDMLCWVLLFLALAGNSLVASEEAVSTEETRTPETFKGTSSGRGKIATLLWLRTPPTAPETTSRIYYEEPVAGTTSEVELAGKSPSESTLSHIADITDLMGSMESPVKVPHGASLPWKAQNHVMPNPQQNLHWQGNFSFVVIADPQLGFMHSDKAWHEEKELLMTVVEHINRLKPSFVALVGDLTNKRPGDKEDPVRERQVADVFNLLGKIDPTIPLLVMPGNHDVGNRPTAVTIERYEKVFGDSYYTFVFGGVMCLVLNSNLLYDPTGAPDLAQKQLDWVESQLEAASNRGLKHIFAFSHHPFFYRTWDEDKHDDLVYFPVTGFNCSVNKWHIPRPRRMIVLELFHKYGVKYTFHGHTHLNNIICNEGFCQIITTAVAWQVGEDKCGLRIVHVQEDDITYEYYPFDEIDHDLRLS